MIRVQGPDGAIAEFPAGTPPETIKAAMAKRYGKPQGAVERMGRNFLDNVAAAGEGAASLVDIPVRAIGGALGLGAKALGLDGVAAQLNNPVTISRGIRAVVPEARDNTLGRTVSSALGGAGAGIGLGARLAARGGAAVLPRAPAVAPAQQGLAARSGAALAANPAQQAIGAGLAGGAMTAAQAAGAPVPVQIGAALVGGALAPSTLDTAATGAAAGLRSYTQGGVREAAARLLQDNANDATAAAARLERAGSVVPGVVPTVGEAALDPGLAALQQSLRSSPRAGGAISQRLGSNAIARGEATDIAFGQGDPRALALAAEDQAAALATARGQAVERVGPVVAPEDAGKAFREALQGRFQAAKMRAGAAYEAIPFGDEPLPLRPVQPVDNLPQPVADPMRAAFQREGEAAAAGNVRGVARETGLPADIREPDPVARGVVAWIRAKGGIKAARRGGKADFVGDLQARGLTSRNAPGLYNNRGYTFDELLTSAQSEGLLSPNATADDLADMIEAAYFGKPQQSWAGVEDGGETARQRLDEWGQLFQSENFDPARASDEDWDALYRSVMRTDGPGAPDVPTPGKLAGAFQNSLSAVASKYFPDGMEAAPGALRDHFARVMQADEATPEQLRRLAKASYDLAALYGRGEAGATAKGMAKAIEAFVRANAAPAYNAALREASAGYRKFARTFYGDEAGRVLGNDRFGVPKLEDARVPAAVVRPGAAGAAAIERASAAAGPDAVEKLTRAQIRREVDAGGADRYGDALRALPGVKADVDAVKQAEAAMDAFRRSELGRLVGDKADPSAVVAEALGKRDGGRSFGRLAMAVRGNKDAEAGLRRALADYVRRASETGGGMIVDEAGEAANAPNVAKLRAAIGKTLDVTGMTGTLGREQRKVLEALKKELGQAEYAAKANRTAGSDTGRNLGVQAQIFRLALSSAAGKGGTLLDIALKALGRADDVRDLAAEAMLDPKLAAELLKTPTPDRVKALAERTGIRALGATTGTVGATQPQPQGRP